MSGDETFVYEEELPDGPNKTEYDLVPEGWYDVVIKSLKGKDTDPDKAPQLSMRMEIINSQFGDTYNGESLFHYLNLPTHDEKKGTRRARQLMLLRIGVISKEDFKGNVKAIDFGLLKGMEATVMVYHDTYRGSTRAKIGFDGWHEIGWRPEGNDKSAAKKTTPAPAPDKKVDSFDDI